MLAAHYGKSLFRAAIVKLTVPLASLISTIEQLREALSDEIQEKWHSATNGDTHEQKIFENKIITESELLYFVDRRWEIVQPLPEGKYLVRKLVQHPIAPVSATNL